MTTSDAHRLISLPVALLALAACGGPEDRTGRATDEEAAGEVPAEAVRTAIADSIHAEGDMVMLEVPGRPGEGPLHMTFDHCGEWRPACSTASAPRG